MDTSRVGRERSPNRARRRLGVLVAVVFGLLAAMAVLASPLIAQGDAASKFNRDGNVLIADQYNNRVIEVTKGGEIVWHFGTGSHKAGPMTVVGPNDAQRVPGGMTLIAGTGVPGGTPGFPKNGAADNRVLLVNRDGKIVWQYGKAGVTGSGPGELNTPVQATWLPNHDVLITDQGNARVIMVNPKGHIVWQYCTTGKTGMGANELNNPNSAELLSNGNILIADEGNNRVIEVTMAKTIAWSDAKGLNAPAFASRLPGGDTLIADGGNARVVQVNHAGDVVWSYTTNTRPGSVKDPAPSQAVRLRNGNTLISDQNNDQVIEVTPSGKIVWSYGKIAKPGDGPGRLNGPYGAKSIGDYTGLTPPTK